MTLAVDAGAVTWGDGMTGVTGAVSASNSLVGSTSGDSIGTIERFAELPGGNYILHSPQWDDGTAVDVGVVTWIGRTGGVADPISASNSLVGSTAADHIGGLNYSGIASGGGQEMNYVFDEINDQLVVGRPDDAMVTLIRLMPLSFHQHLPLIVRP